MKITIDTRKDSKEDMGRAVELLKGIIGQTPTREEKGNTGYVNMFASQDDQAKDNDDKPDEDVSIMTY